MLTVSLNRLGRGEDVARQPPRCAKAVTRGRTHWARGGPERTRRSERSERWALGGGIIPGLYNYPLITGLAVSPLTSCIRSYSFNKLEGKYRASILLSMDPLK